MIAYVLGRGLPKMVMQIAGGVVLAAIPLMFAFLGLQEIAAPDGNRFGGKILLWIGIALGTIVLGAALLK